MSMLEEQGISEKAPDSMFMTDPQRWLDSLEVSIRPRR